MPKSTRHCQGASVRHTSTGNSFRIHQTLTRRLRINGGAFAPEMCSLHTNPLTRASSRPARLEPLQQLIALRQPSSRRLPVSVRRRLLPAGRYSGGQRGKRPANCPFFWTPAGELRARGRAACSECPRVERPARPACQQPEPASGMAGKQTG